MRHRGDGEGWALSFAVCASSGHGHGHYDSAVGEDCTEEGADAAVAVAAARCSETGSR